MKLTSEQLSEYLIHMHERLKKALETDIIIHGYMIYRCKECGSIYVLWLEKGLEDPTNDQNGGQHKPVPFGIVCPLCGGQAFHSFWDATGDTLGKNYRPYKDYTNSSGLIYENFFWNDPNSPHGVPIIISPDYPSVKNEEVFYRITEIRLNTLKCNLEEKAYKTTYSLSDICAFIREAIEKLGSDFSECSDAKGSIEPEVYPSDGKMNREQRRHRNKQKNSWKRSRSNKKMYEY